MDLSRKFVAHCPWRVQVYEKNEVRCALIDFAYAHEHNNELPPDEVDDGLGTSSKLLKDGQLLAALSPP